MVITLSDRLRGHRKMGKIRWNHGLLMLPQPPFMKSTQLRFFPCPHQCQSVGAKSRNDHILRRRRTCLFCTFKRSPSVSTMLLASTCDTLSIAFLWVWTGGMTLFWKTPMARSHAGCSYVDDLIRSSRKTPNSITFGGLPVPWIPNLHPTQSSANLSVISNCPTADVFPDRG